jgi:hypothetical protein
VADRTWFRADVLNKGIGWGWFYIGALPLLALAFTPWVFGRFRWRRDHILTLLALLLVLLLWQASRYPPVSVLYARLPFLYTFRFPNRLLIVATIPLVALAALTLQGSAGRGAPPGTAVGACAGGTGRRRMAGGDAAAAALLLGAALADVYRTNQPFATNPHPRNQVARGALSWLRREDPSLYYTNIGGTADLLGLGGLRLRAGDAHAQLPLQPARALDGHAGCRGFTVQRPAEVRPGRRRPHTVGSGHATGDSFNGVNVWRRDDALPFAFAADPDGPITWQTVAGQAARLDGPNRVIVTADVNTAGRHLVVLVSDYPGWQLWIDGQRAAVVPLNGYLGAAAARRGRTPTSSSSGRPHARIVGMGVSAPGAGACASG